MPKICVKPGWQKVKGSTKYEKITKPTKQRNAVKQIADPEVGQQRNRDMRPAKRDTYA
ncbi:hypothetical protein FHT87_004780 [Rhizobium sp. BK316]|uniref:hypothetical protein n=1 Tax=Rhizobium sp. BK316 TaxID=2587053 RepID=UPI00160E5DAF|nr:hypothetical protein [Rhizobium sp. BK316]MBB3410833.1 hypothetical protein [Rhizobium sp. BK316]